MIRPALCAIVLCLGTTSLPAADDQALIAPAEIEAFQTRFDSLRKKRDEKKALLDKEEAAGNTKPAIVIANNRNMRRHYLHLLMVLEHNFNVLATPPAQDDDLDIPGLSSSDTSRVPKLHAEIHAAERKRIQAALAKNLPFHGDEKAEEALLKKEARLDALFGKASKQFDRDIKELERDLAREEASSIPDEKEIDSLIDELQKVVDEKKALFPPIYGHPAKDDFDSKGPLKPQAAEDLRLALKKERELVLSELRGDNENEGEEGKKGGVVGGSFIYSSNLGVILDISGSMTKFIEPLKKEIAQSFSNPHYREVAGCRLKEGSLTLASGTRQEKEHVMSAIEELIVVHQVDTVYWFCDLNDGYTMASIRRLRHLFLHTGVAFHVKSVKRRPDRELKNIITDFKG